jgi:hypothetical protein
MLCKTQFGWEFATPELRIKLLANEAKPSIIAKTFLPTGSAGFASGMVYRNGNQLMIV